jgi:hypothetical protein
LRLADFNPRKSFNVYVMLQDLLEYGFGCERDAEKAKYYANLVEQNVGQCNLCRKSDVNVQFKRCSACKKSLYCSDEHQRQDWTEEHKVRPTAS